MTHALTVALTVASTAMENWGTSHAPVDFQRCSFLHCSSLWSKSDRQLSEYSIIRKIPLSSDRKHLSYDGCLEVRGEIVRTVQNSCVLKLCSHKLMMMISGGLAHRETGRFPGGPLLREFFRAPGRTCEFISLIISWHSRQTGSAFTEPVERPPYLPVGGPHVCSGSSCYVCEKFSGRVQMYMTVFVL